MFARAGAFHDLVADFETFELDDADELFAALAEGLGICPPYTRAIAGTLVEIGLGRRHPGWIETVLASRDRAEAGRNAPPQGLFLVRVTY